MEFIQFVIFFLVGLFISSLTILQVFIILFFGIPTTRKIRKLGYLKNDNKIIRNYFISVGVISTIFLISYYIIYNLFPNGLSGFLIGLGATLLFGLSKIGMNKENISDFVESNKSQFTEHPGKIIEAILIS